MTIAIEQHQQAEPRLEGLYRELYPPLLRYAEGMLGSRCDAEEAVQDAFTAAARVGPVDEPRPWLFTVTRNAAISAIRRRRGLVSLEVVGEGVLEVGTSEGAAEAADDLRMLRVGLERLQEPGRSALLLRELGDLSYREIAEVLGTSEGNVKVVIFRARKALADIMEAANLTCDDVQMTLSAAADGEVARPARALARLHVRHCASCRGFAGSLGRQRATFAALVPVLPMEHSSVHMPHLFDGLSFPGLHLVQSGDMAATTTAAGTAAGTATAAGGGLLGLKAAMATTAVVATVTAGGAAVMKNPKLVAQLPIPHMLSGDQSRAQASTPPVPRHVNVLNRVPGTGTAPLVAPIAGGIPSPAAAQAEAAEEAAGTPPPAATTGGAELPIPPAGEVTDPIVTDPLPTDGTTDPTATDPGTTDGVDPTTDGSGVGVTDPGTTDPGATDPGTTDPGATDPGSTDPGSTDPGATDPGTTDPGATDPGSTDPGSTDPGATDPGSTDPGSTDPGATDPGSTDTGSTDTGSTDPGDGGTTDAADGASGSAADDAVVDPAGADDASADDASAGDDDSSATLV